MASLRELHAQLVALREAGKSAKVSFYYPKDPTGQDLRLLSGYIAVDQGQRCYLSLQGLPPLEALALIPSLPFSRVASLPALRFDGTAEGHLAVPIDEVLDALDPARTPPPQRAAAVEAAPAVAPPVAAVPAVPAVPVVTFDEYGFPKHVADDVEAPAATHAEAKAPRAFYSHVAMQADAVALLETLYGLGAAKKVEEFVFNSPPHQHPAEFLGKCVKQAAMMIGPKKAAQMFAPIYDKAGLPKP